MTSVSAGAIIAGAGHARADLPTPHCRMNEPPKPVREDQKLASYIAMVIRNAMEDFHCRHLTDDQMQVLNPIIRDAICTALHAFNNYERAGPAARFVDYHFRMIPKYWEAPELLDGYVEMWSRDGRASAGDGE